MAIRSPKTFAKINNAVENRVPFKANGSLDGVDYYISTIGYLPETYAAMFYDHAKHGAVDMYIVRSYFTPIAWWTEAHGWIVPRVSYSVTTSQHQTAVRRAIETAGLTYSE